MTSRRQFIRTGAAATAGLFLPWSRIVRPASAIPLASGLSDPAVQPKFINPVPNALDPGFQFVGKKGKYRVSAGRSVQYTGLVGPDGTTPVPTTVYGYGDKNTYTWPGRTFQVHSGEPIEVMWHNKLIDTETGAYLPHLLPVDESLHWAYSLHGYEDYSIENSGIPIVVHLHGGHTRDIYDGNPEYFFSPGFGVRGPRWAGKKYIYDNDQPAGNLWYHDHALGITRLNVYAGMAGFYFVRDTVDTGKSDNPPGLPAYPYELAYAIQDRMFRENGELFYPGYPGDPFWDDFITGEGLEDDDVPQPSALAEFFGDHMVVNGVIWPKAAVEPRHYRMRLLNGTDSRFLVVRFRPVPAGATDYASAGAPLPFYVIGSDQGLAAAATQTETLVFEPGGRYDIVVDFSQVPAGSRVIMENIGGDAPFGGEFGDALDADDFFPDRQTDRIMAFDVLLPRDETVSDRFDPDAIGHFGGVTAPTDNVRKVALFEGNDEYGRLQPLLGVAAPARDTAGDWVDGAIGWHSPTTENPATGDTEEWEIYNATGDAHPVHLHLVHFEILGRQEFSADLIEQAILQHNGETGIGFRLQNIELGSPVGPMTGYVENAPKDMVTALPGQVTRIKATFDRPGRYVWHCHILSHEDHEMMRVLHVGPEAPMYAKAASSQRAAFATASSPTATFALEQNYPNPFNPSTTIRFSLPAATQVRLEVFDMLGRRVAKLVDGEQSAGSHEVSFNARRLSSGTYVYRLTAGKQTVTKRMYLLK